METLGTYIVIEGQDATGKSTQADMLARKLIQQGHEVVEFHEPDGVPIAQELRNVIKNGTLGRTALTNVLLFSAARRENWLQQGLPTLERGGYVVSARNYYSTLVYQGIAEGLKRGKHQLEDIEFIESLTREATDERYMNPDYAFMLDIDDEAERARRIASRGAIENPDTFESRGQEFQFSVNEGYRFIAKQKSIPLVSANQSPDDIHQFIWRGIHTAKNT